MNTCSKRTAIIGKGTASVECFKAMRKYGYSGDIDVFAADDLPVYNPMLTSYYVSGKIPYEMMFPYGCDFSIFDKYKIALHKNTKISKIDAHNHIIISERGKEYSFEQCLIATGASAFIPRFPGSDNNKIYTMRTIEDAIRLKSALETSPQKALIVGASMVGIKVTELFLQAGIECCLTDMAPFVFPLAANEECAHIIEDKITSKGIRLRLSSELESVEENESGIRAWFKGSDEPEDADLLLMCVGVHANTSMVDTEQIVVQQGILVNEKMETNAKNIYAAGDDV